MQMRSQLVGPFLGRVRLRGGDPEALIRRFRLPASAETDSETMLPLETLHALLEAVEEATGDPFVGIHLEIADLHGRFIDQEISYFTNTLPITGDDRPPARVRILVRHLEVPELTHSLQTGI